MHIAKLSSKKMADRIQAAIDVIVKYGGTDGAHHKDWVLDQAVRTLTGCTEEVTSEAYQAVVAKACDGEDGPGTYEWEVGIAP